MIDRIGLVPGWVAYDFQGHILFFQADKVNASGGFEPVPKEKIDDGFVPDIKHLAAHGRSLSQLFLGQAFEGVHIVFFLAAGGGQTSEGAAAQIQDIEMAGGMSLPINDGIMTGGLVPVAVTRIEVKIIQLGEHGQFIGQTFFEAAGKELIDFLE